MDLSPIQAEALNELRHSTAQYVVGVDEVGRGAWAGPLVVCGIVFMKGWGSPDVKDSKHYGSNDEARRKVIYTHIEPNVQMKYIGSRTSQQVDSAGGVEAALQELNTEVIRALVVHYNDCIVVTDGNRAPECEEARRIICLPKADVLVPAVSAASVVAKVYRDARMVRFHQQYPEYDFHNNKGYHSDVHKSALEEYGPCDIHRFSFKPVIKAARNYDPQPPANILEDHG